VWYYLPAINEQTFLCHGRVLPSLEEVLYLETDRTAPRFNLCSFVAPFNTSTIRRTVWKGEMQQALDPACV